MATTPKAAAKKSVPKSENEIVLPSGAIATKIPFKGKHVMQARRLGGTDQEEIIYALIAICTLIDGKSVVVEDLKEIDGRDLIKLMEIHQGLFS